MMRKRLFLMGILMAGAGCAMHDQVQYFEVVDPESGNVNYYRMTVRGHGGFGVDYHLQAGYFSAASVDVLRGQMPNLPEVDLPVEQDAAFDRLVSQYYEALTTAGDRLAASRTGAPPDEGLDDAVLRQARLVWFGQLSPADVAAMGMNQTANPFQFRKLVFWAASKNVDLRMFGNEIDAMISNATALVRAQKSEGRWRDARREGLQTLLGNLVEHNPALEPYSGVIEAVFGAERKTAAETEEP